MPDSLFDTHVHDRVHTIVFPCVSGPYSMRKKYQHACIHRYRHYLLPPLMVPDSGTISGGSKFKVGGGAISEKVGGGNI